MTGLTKTVGIRFSHSGGNTDFYCDEIPTMEHFPAVQKIDLSFDRYGIATMYLIGDPHQEFIVSFKMNRDDTTDKLKTLFNLVDAYNQPEKITIFYNYNNFPTLGCMVQMKRDDYKEYFRAGFKAAGDIVQILFVQTWRETGMLSGLQQQLLGNGA